MILAATIGIIAGFILLMFVITLIFYKKIANRSNEVNKPDKTDTVPDLNIDSFLKDEIGDLVKSFKKMERKLTH